MNVLSGHLTQSQKTEIKAILALNLLSGKVGRTYYQMFVNSDIYTVKITIIDKGLIPCAGSKLRPSNYYSTFKI